MLDTDAKSTNLTPTSQSTTNAARLAPIPEEPSGMSLSVNGMDVRLPDDPRVSLLDLLRERLQLTGTKKGCDQGACGACTVLADGQRILSCLALAVQYQGRCITPSRVSGPRSSRIRSSAPSSSMTASSAATVRPARSARR